MDAQKKCFGKDLSTADLEDIKMIIQRTSASAATDRGINEKGFILLNRLFAEKGRHETTWTILRTFHYTDSLSLRDDFLHPR